MIDVLVIVLAFGPPLNESEASFKAKKLQLSQQSDDSAQVPDDDVIYLEVVEGPNKQDDVYGLGSRSSSFIDKNSRLISRQISISVMHNFVEQALIDFTL